MLVEIWSDIVCPWCAVGKARFERALQQFDHRDDVAVRWRSFELDANRRSIPDLDYPGLLAKKYGTSREQAQAMIDRMTDAGAQDGIEFRFDIARPGNTFDAHRLLHLAADRGLQHELKDRLLAAYHSEGARIADHAELTRLATQAGLDEDEVIATLATDAYADAVRADEAMAAEIGVRGVPFFVFDRRVAVSGAQPADGMLAVLEKVWAMTAEAAEAAVDDTTDHHAHDHAPGETCHDGACAI